MSMIKTDASSSYSYFTSTYIVTALISNIVALLYFIGFHKHGGAKNRAQTTDEFDNVQNAGKRQEHGDRSLSPCMICDT